MSVGTPENSAIQKLSIIIIIIIIIIISHSCFRIEYIPCKILCLPETARTEGRNRLAFKHFTVHEIVNSSTAALELF